MSAIHAAFPVVPDSIGKCEKTFLYTLYGCIEQNGHQPGFGVQQLAGSAQLSRVHLNRKLSQLLGCSALSLITGYRFHAARQLLNETDMPVKEIAARCGFRRPGAFCRSFTTAFGYPPSQCRTGRRAGQDVSQLQWRIPLLREDMAVLEQLTAERTWLHRLLQAATARISDQVFTTDQLAAVAGMSSGTLNRRTRELLNITPQRLIRDIRLQYACELLAAGGSTIAAIAYETGFFDPAHFCRCFKAATGCAPSDYRPSGDIASVRRLKERLMNQNGK